MTDVAQVAAVVDMDGVTSEDERDISDAEKEDDDSNESKVKKDRMSQVKEGKTRRVCDEGGSKADKTHNKGVKHKENDDEEQEGTDAQDAENQENEDLNISDLALKKKVGGNFK